MNAIRDSFARWLAALGRRPRQPAVAASVSQQRLLHKRLEHARLAKMLDRMHVSRDAYLQRVHPDLLREQLDACAACPHAFRCDEIHACARRADPDLSFCQNLDSIRAQRRAA